MNWNQNILLELLRQQQQIVKDSILQRFCETI